MISLEKPSSSSDVGQAALSPPSSENKLIESLFENYNSVLRKFLARRLPTEEDVSDIVQETYLRIIRHKDKKSITHPRAFMFMTATNLLRDRLRRNRTRAVDRHISLDDTEITCSKPSAEQILQSKQQIQILEKALLELEPECRRALILHRFDELTYEQIACELGVTYSVARKYVSRGLIHCHERLQEIHD